MTSGILFYSDFCPHSRMLLDTVKRYSSDNVLSMVSIESVMKTGKKLSMIHSVPAIITMPEKKLLFGKDVFDFLLLPGRGLLTSRNNDDERSPSNDARVPEEPEPAAFNMSMSGLSDSYSEINEDSYNDRGQSHRLYNWSHLESECNTVGVNTESLPSVSNDTRTKKEVPNLSDYKERRAQELIKSDLNISPLPPSISGRDDSNGSSMSF